MTFVKQGCEDSPVPNQPKTPIYGFRYPRKDQMDALAARWGVSLTAIGIFAADEFLAKYGDAPNPPPALRASEEGGDDE
jgi:hypothetical protein